MDDSGDVSEVEEVVEARWYGQHVLVELSEHIDGGGHGNISTLPDIVGEEIGCEELIDDGVEDLRQDLL